MKVTGDQKLVWVDTDISIGEVEVFPFFYKDVDDGYALIALFNSASVKLAGISTVFGNTKEQDATQLANEVVSRFGPKYLSVAPGATQPLDYHHPVETPATKAMADALANDPMTILSIGPATNIATLLLLHPELENRIQEVVVVAGRRSQKQHFRGGDRQLKPFRDLNFEVDVDAYRVLLASKVKVTLVPFEVCHKVWITDSDLARLAQGPAAAQFLARNSKHWMKEWKRIFGADGFNPFDAVAAGYVINPGAFTSALWPVDIQDFHDDTKLQKDEEKSYLISNPQLGTQRKVNYIYDVALDFKDQLLELLITKGMATYVLGLSHVNIIVDNMAEATAFYQRVLGFEQAVDHLGQAMDYPGVDLASFARDAGFMDGKVKVHVRFLRHPQAELFLELMVYDYPQGSQEIQIHQTNDLGGVRHVALEVNDIQAVFDYLKTQEGVSMISNSPEYKPEILSPFPITFFYWIDRYGVQWEMEEGRRVGTLRGILP